MAEGKERYAIVRVDINCPKDVCGEEDFCFLSKGKTLADMCDHCEFLQEKRIIGDTKVQLIKKIMTAFKIAIKKNKEGKFVKEKSNNRQVAEIIVEYLGVK